MAEVQIDQCDPGQYNGYLGRKWNTVQEKKKQKAMQEYASLDAYIVRQYRESRESYLVDFFTRKAKVDNASLVYGVIAALVINLSWQFVSSFFLSATPPDTAPSDLLFALKVFTLVMNFVFLATSVALVYIFYFFNRKQKKQLLLEEFILNKRGYLS